MKIIIAEKAYDYEDLNAVKAKNYEDFDFLI